MTLARASLAIGVAALTAASFERNVAVATLATLASVALALDFVDGWVARRTASETALGAKLDGEVDAFLILVLSIDVAPTVGAWVLLIGAARYLLLAAGWRFHWLRAQLPRRDWRKTVTAAQGVALAIAAAGVVSTGASTVLLAVALALLAQSFGRDVWWLWRRRGDAPARVATVRHPAVTSALTIVALLVVWAALVAPIRPWQLTRRLLRARPAQGCSCDPRGGAADPCGAFRGVAARAVGRRAGGREALRPGLLRLSTGRSTRSRTGRLSGRRGDGARHVREQGR